MKRIFIYCFLLLFIQNVKAQRDKEFQIRGGLGWSIYAAHTEITYDVLGLHVTDEKDDGAATVHLPLELRYELSQRFNIGVDMKIGSYLYDPDSAEGKSNHFFVFGLAAEYNFINKDNFRWYGGAGFNAAALELEENGNDFGFAVKEIWDYKGGGFRMNTGILWFFIHPLGLNLNLGFDSHNFNLSEYEINGQNQDLSDLDAKLSVAGIDGTIGFVIRL